MAATEFIWATSRDTTISPQCHSDTEKALLAQNAWFAARAGSGASPSDDSGVVYFQQIENPTVYLTAGRAAPAEHFREWRRSEEAAAVMPPLREHFVADQTVFMAVEGSGFLTAASAGAATPLVDSPVVSVARCAVAAGDRAAFAQSWQSVRGVLEAFARPHSVHGVWKIRGEEDAGSDEEFVVLCGWPSLERHAEFAATEDYAKYTAALKEKSKGGDIKSYRRVV